MYDPDHDPFPITKLEAVTVSRPKMFAITPTLWVALDKVVTVSSNDDGVLRVTTTVGTVFNVQVDDLERFWENWERVE